MTETQEQFGYRAAYLVSTNRDPGDWYGYYGNRSLTIGDLKAELVHKDTGDEEVEYERDVVVVVKVASSDGREVFLRAAGSTDSYGSNATFGSFRVVTPKTKMVTVYE